MIPKKKEIFCQLILGRDSIYKGYCSTKNQYYYGLKLHALTFRRIRHDPFANKIVFADKAYSDFNYFDDVRKQQQSIEIFTPVKGVKGELGQEKQRNRAYNDLFQQLGNP